MKKKFVSAYITGAILYIPFSMIFNYIAPFARELGATDFHIGLISTVYFLVTIFSSPFWGSISDLVENRKIFTRTYRSYGKKCVRRESNLLC